MKNLMHFMDNGFKCIKYKAQSFTFVKLFFLSDIFKRAYFDTPTTPH